MKVFLTLIFVVLIFSIPIIYADVQTVKIDNKTFLITVNENNPVNIPPINIPPTNTSGIEKIIREVDEGHSKWSEGDILITSGTIFAFFSLGSFLVDRMEGRNKEQQMKVIQVILGFTGGIQSMHLFIVILIVIGQFNPIIYSEVIGLTIFALWVILYGVHEMYSLNSKESDEKDQFILDAYKKVEASFDRIRDQKRKDREEGE